MKKFVLFWIFGMVSLSWAAAQGSFEKGISYYKQGQYARAVEEFEQIVASSPDYEAGYRVLGDSYLKLRQYAKAAAAFRKAVELKDDNFVSHYGLAVAQFNQGQYRDTAATLLRAERIARSPRERYQLFHTRGAAYFNLNDFPRAVTDLQNAVSIQRGDFSDTLQLGISNLRLGNFAEAEKFLTQAVALNPQSGEARRFLAGIAYEKGINAIEQRNYRQAVGFLKPYVAENPADGSGWFNLGLAQLFSEDLSGAEESFKQAVKLAPDNWEAYQRLGFIYEKTNRYDQSLLNYRKALELHRDAGLQESVERVQERLKRRKSS